MKKVVSTLGQFALVVALIVPSASFAEGFYGGGPIVVNQSVNFFPRPYTPFYGGPGYGSHGMPGFGGGCGPWGGPCGPGFGGGYPWGGRQFAGGCHTRQHWCRNHHRCERHRRFRSFSLSLGFGFGGFSFGLGINSVRF